MEGYEMMMSEQHLLWTIFWWVVGAGVIVAFAWWVLRVVRRPSDRIGGNSPEQVLENRYAKGEIDRETYERMRMRLNLRA
jgi:putative membrane protein